MARGLSLPGLFVGPAPDGFIPFSDLENAPADTEVTAATPEGLLASYNGASLTHAQAIHLGQEAAGALNSSPTDRTCVSITLCHAFGMGSGVGSALVSEGAVVLPAVNGIRGCGDPKQRAVETGAVLAETQSTLLFADTHVIKHMPAAAGAVQLRGGVVKVSSGTEIWEGGDIEYAGVPLHSIGKKPAV
jgi:hypothetical protein